ncbi:MAG: hypothetical protein ACXAC7_22265, partial [Candidatus Hodarchaeales archaeon]
MIDLGSEYPILFFPLRIETKYSYESTNKSLRIRFFPDQISIEQLDGRLTRKEYIKAVEYWETVKNNISLDKEAFESILSESWSSIASDYGNPRTAFIIKKVLNNYNTEFDIANPEIKQESDFNFRNEEDHITANYNTLPKQFLIYAEFKNSSLPPLRYTVAEEIQTLNLKVSPLKLFSDAFYGSRKPIPSFIDSPPEDPLVEIDPELKWLSNFNEAKNKGMAAEINLTDDQYKSGFKFIIVYGIRTDENPQKTKDLIDKLFNSHHYTSGLSFVNQNTPTNLTDPQSNDKIVFNPDTLSWIRNEFEKLNENSDGSLFQKYLGLESVSQGAQNSNIMEQLNAKKMASALFPAVLGNFIQIITTYSEKKISVDFKSIKSYFQNYVSTPGIIFRIGKVPYGLLPLTLTDEWEDTLLIPGKNFVVEFIKHFSKIWLNKSKNVSTVMRPLTGLTSEKNLINILSMEAHSQSYYSRGVRPTQYLYFMLKYFFNYPGTLSEFQKGYNDQVKNKLNNFFSKFNSPYSYIFWAFNMISGEGIKQLEYPLVGDPVYIKEIIDNIDNYYKKTNDTHIANFQDTPLLYKLLVFSANFLGINAIEENQKDIFVEDLKILSELSKEKLELMLLKTLDYTSYRLDSWITSLANQRIGYLRNKTDFKKGLLMGVYGWVEDLFPNKKYNATEGGYIHSFSQAHASAFAVARDGYLNHLKDPSKGDLLKLNLNSERIKNALELLQALQSISLPEYLGIKFERLIHDSKIDFVKDEFRKVFPIQTSDLNEFEDLNHELQDFKFPRNVTNGLLIYEEWKRLIEKRNGNSLQNLMSSDELWNKLLIRIRKYGNESNLLNILEKHFNYLLNVVDGLSDLSIYESIFQAVNMKFDHSAAIIDGMSGGEYLANMESPNIPITGPRLTLRILVPKIVSKDINSLSIPEIEDIPTDWNPSRVAEPYLFSIIAEFIDDIRFWNYATDNDGKKVPID